MLNKTGHHKLGRSSGNPSLPCQTIAYIKFWEKGTTKDILSCVSLGCVVVYHLHQIDSLKPMVTQTALVKFGSQNKTKRCEFKKGTFRKGWGRDNREWRESN